MIDQIEGDIDSLPTVTVWPVYTKSKGNENNGGVVRTPICNENGGQIQKKSPKKVQFNPIVQAYNVANSLVEDSTSIYIPMGIRRLQAGKEQVNSIPLNVPPRSPDSPSSISSLERRACRICQSETGDMVRPCGCAGTMGDIHENCLSLWVATSNKKICEICHEEYAKGGCVLKPIREWSKPQLNSADAVSVFTVAGLVYSMVYIVLLMQERLFYERWQGDNLPMRSDDVARILIFVIMFMLTMGMFCLYYSLAHKYLTKQKTIRFINKYHCNGATIGDPNEVKSSNT